MDDCWTTGPHSSSLSAAPVTLNSSLLSHVHLCLDVRGLWPYKESSEGLTVAGCGEKGLRSSFQGGEEDLEFLKRIAFQSKWGEI